MSGKLSARERLVAAAMALFYEQGIQATGIDTIVKHAGVAKMSLYNNFASKDDLVRAYLEGCYVKWLDCYRACVQKSQSQVEEILAVYDAHIENFERNYAGTFRGCPLLNAASELPLGNPTRQVISERKHRIETDIAQCLLRMKLPSDKSISKIAEHLSYLLEGALCISGLKGTIQPLKIAKAIATTELIQLSEKN